MDMNEELSLNLKICRGPLCLHNNIGTKKDKSAFNKKQSWCIECYKFYYTKGEGRNTILKYNQSDGAKTLRRNQRLLKLYGISLEDYKDKLIKQDNRCAICKEIAGDDRLLCIDHDHRCCPTNLTCGRCMRGLLCDRCNRVLGMIKDNIEISENILYYLNSYETERKWKKNF